MEFNVIIKKAQCNFCQEVQSLLERTEAQKFRECWNKFQALL
jgi:hypothetical protein